MGGNRFELSEEENRERERDRARRTRLSFFILFYTLDIIFIILEKGYLLFNNNKK
jgi:predicted nucleic acid-binding Zn ribbon protein